MKYISNFNSFSEEEINESLKDWIISAALATMSLKSKGQESVTKFNGKFKTEILKKTSDTSLQIDFGSEFGSGEHSFSDSKSNILKNKFTQIAEFINEFKQYDIMINIEASESRVPNIDARTGERLPVGALADLRAEETKKCIEQLVSQMPDSQKLSISFNIDNKIGGPYYQKSESPRQPKFTEHQYVKVILALKGKKTIHESGELKICGYQREFKGNLGSPEMDFVVDTNIVNMGGGSGRIGFKFDPVSVPDIFVVEYNGKRWITPPIGDNRPYYRIVFATIIANYYADKEMPEWFKDLKYSPISKKEAKKTIESDPNASVHDFRALGKYRNFDDILKDTSINLYTLDSDQIENFDRTAPNWAESNWGIIIDKIEGIDEVKFFAIGVISQTRWNLYVDCMECNK